MRRAFTALWSRPRLRAAASGAAGVTALIAVDLAMPSPVVAGAGALSIELIARAAGVPVTSPLAWILLVALGVALGVAFGEGFREFTRTGALRAGAVWGLAMSVLVAPFLLPFGAQIVILDSLPASFALVTRWFMLLVLYGTVLAWVEAWRPRPASRARR